MVTLMTDRAWKKPTYAIGRFFVNGERMCESLEDTDRGLFAAQAYGSIILAKIPGKTAIPTGEYTVKLTFSPKFSKKAWCKKYNGLVPEILDVKGFSGVRIHPGNTAADTEGCILIGDNKAVGKLTNSQKRYYQLMDKYLMPAYNAGEEIKIIIK